MIYGYLLPRAMHPLETNSQSQNMRTKTRNLTYPTFYIFPKQGATPLYYPFMSPSCHLTENPTFKNSGCEDVVDIFIISLCIWNHCSCTYVIINLFFMLYLVTSVHLPLPASLSVTLTKNNIRDYESRPRQMPRLEYSLILITTEMSNLTTIRPKQLACCRWARSISILI